MNAPEFPSIAQREVGIQVNITTADIPYSWCGFLQTLSKYILNLCNEEPAAFQSQVKKLRDYMVALQEAISLYEDKAGQEDPSVPFWYEEIAAAWGKDPDDEEDPLVDILCRVCDLTDSKELELKAGLLLNIFQLDWPDFIEENIKDINAYLGSFV